LPEDEFYHRPAGQLLQPKRDTAEAIDELRREIGSRVFAAQYQQNPTPPDGNIIKASWLGRYDRAPDRSSLQRVVLSCDPTGKLGAHNDYTAITIVGVQQQALYVLHVSRGHWRVMQMPSRSSRQLGGRASTSRICNLVMRMAALCAVLAQIACWATADARDEPLMLPEVVQHELPLPPSIIPLQQPYYKSKDQEPGAGNRGSEHSPIVVKVLPYEGSQEDKNQANAKAELDRELTEYTGKLAFYTEYLFIATLVLASLTGALAWVAGRQMKDARKAIVAAQVSAKASEQHVHIAERSLIDLERAYITAGIKGTATVIGANQSPGFIVLRASVSNYGKTPGFIDHVHWHIGPYGSTDPEELPITSDGYQNHIFVGWVIGPNTRPGEELQTNELGRAQVPLAAPLIFHGLVTYTDIFEKTHYCGFAYRINQNGSWQPISKVDAYVRRD
jgi:hypothetical protein